MKNLFVLIISCASVAAISKHELSRRGALNPEDGTAVNGQCTTRCSSIAADIKRCDGDDDCFCTAGVRAEFVDCSNCNAGQDPSRLSKLKETAAELVRHCADNDTPIDPIILNGPATSNNSTNSGGTSTGTQTNGTDGYGAQKNGTDGSSTQINSTSHEQPLTHVGGAHPTHDVSLLPLIGMLGSIMWFLRQIRSLEAVA